MAGTTRSHSKDEAKRHREMVLVTVVGIILTSVIGVAGVYIAYQAWQLALKPAPSASSSAPLGITQTGRSTSDTLKGVESTEATTSVDVSDQTATPIPRFGAIQHALSGVQKPYTFAESFHLHWKDVNPAAEALKQSMNDRLGDREAAVTVESPMQSIDAAANLTGDYINVATGTIAAHMEVRMQVRSPVGSTCEVFAKSQPGASIKEISDDFVSAIISGADSLERSGTC